MRSSRVRLALFMVVLAALASHSDVLVAAEPPVPFYEVGSLSRAITTASPEAQKYFDQGLAFMFAFNHDEAIRSFQRAAELDPGCAMAHWGVALANGPHINNPVLPPERAKAAWEALVRAQAAAAGASPVEKALIEALAARYADAAAGGPQAARRRLRERDARGLGGLPEGRRRRRALRRGADGPAAVGPLDARRQAAAGDRGADRARSRPCARSIRGIRSRSISTSTRSRPRRAGAGRRGGRRAARAPARPRPPRPHAVAHRRPARALGGGDRRQYQGDRGRRALPARSREQGFYRLYMAHNHHMLAYAAMM